MRKAMIYLLVVCLVFLAGCISPAPMIACESYKLICGEDPGDDSERCQYLAEFCPTYRREDREVVFVGPPEEEEEAVEPIKEPIAEEEAPTAEGWIAFRRSGEIHKMRPDGSELTLLTSPTVVEAYLWSHSWSPDGEWIAFEGQPGWAEEFTWEIYKMRADGSEVTRLTYSKILERIPSWSPDGQWITFQSGWASSTWDFYKMRPDGSQVTRLTYNEAPHFSGYSWSPDGRWIAFVYERDGNRDIYKMQAHGSGLTRLTDNEASDHSPSWSRDGHWIAFTSDRDGNREIYKMRADGSEQTRLTYNEALDKFPSWSPDGQWIAFDSDRDGQPEIYKMRADGSDVTRLTYNEGEDVLPSWGPPAAVPSPGEMGCDVSDDLACFVSQAWKRVEERRLVGNRVIGNRYDVLAEVLADDAILANKYQQALNLVFGVLVPPPSDLEVDILDMLYVEREPSDFDRSWLGLENEPFKIVTYYSETIVGYNVMNLLEYYHRTLPARGWKPYGEGVDKWVMADHGAPAPALGTNVLSRTFWVWYGRGAVVLEYAEAVATSE